MFFFLLLLLLLRHGAACFAFSLSLLVVEELLLLLPLFPFSFFSFPLLCGIMYERDDKYPPGALRRPKRFFFYFVVSGLLFLSSLWPLIFTTHVPNRCINLPTDPQRPSSACHVSLPIIDLTAPPPPNHHFTTTRRPQPSATWSSTPAPPHSADPPRGPTQTAGGRRTPHPGC